jgi:myo-inositol-1(or 4)-monophosphatase
VKIQWEYESELALKAVSSGGEFTLDRPDRFKVSTKESLRDVVTELDVQIEKHITKILAPSKIQIIGEEGSQPNDSLPANELYWAVDPIDGTANFVSGLPYYGVSVGLCQGNDFLVGAVSLPALKELFFTHGDRGAFLNGKPIRIADAALAQSLVGVSFAGAKGDQNYRARQYEFFGLVNDSSRGSLRLGSAAANICYVASGRLQAAYGLDARIWDIAGALAVAKQAGGTVMTRPGSSPSRINYIVGSASAAREIQELALKKEIIL